MRRSCAFRWVIVASVGLVWGCGAPPKGNWFSRSTSDAAETDRSAETTDRKTVSPTEGAIRSPGTQQMADSSATPIFGHDAATTRYIEQELRDATPEEREDLSRNLKQLDPFWVRQILRTRRQTITMQQKAAQRERIAAGSAWNENRAVTAHGVQPWGAPDGRAGLGHPVRPVSGHANAVAASGPDVPGPWDTSYGPSTQQFGRADDRSNQANAMQYPAASPANPVRLGSGDLHSVPWGPSTPPVQTAPYSATVPNQGGPAVALKSSGMQPRSLPAAPAAGFQANPAGNMQAMYPPQAPPAGQQAGWFDANRIQAVAGGTMQAIAPGLSHPGGAAPFGGVAQATLPAGPASQWDGQLQRLISLAEAETATLGPGTTEAEKENYIEKHVYLRWLYLIAGSRAKALEAIPELAPADQEFWQQMFWAVANYFDSDAMPDDSDRATQTITQLRSAIQRLQENARLDLRNVTFCHKISSFGDYERFKRDEFSPGQPVLIYAEVANFKSEPTADGQFRTLLRSAIEIYKAGPAGGLVKREEFPATEDLCRNHRKDYFHSYQIDIPQRITLGPHVLKLIVEDQLSRKVATYSLQFTVK